jgi:hypothetical protein
MARTEVPGGAIQAEGLGQLVRSLKAVGADKTEISEANFQAAQTLIRAALPRVPVLTGRLKSSLRPARAQGSATARAGNNGTLGYAAPIHWGWAVVGPRTKSRLRPGSIRNIEPQPFFSEALGYTYEEILTNYNNNMQNLVNKYGLGDKL